MSQYAGDAQLFPQRGSGKCHAAAPDEDRDAVVIRNISTQIHLDVVLPAVVHEGDYALRSFCPIDGDSINHDAVYGHAAHLLSTFHRRA